MAGMDAKDKAKIINAIKQSGTSGKPVGFALGTAGKSHAEHILEVKPGAKGGQVSGIIKKEHQNPKIHAFGSMILEGDILYVQSAASVDKIAKNITASIGKVSLWKEIRKRGDSEDEADIDPVPTYEAVDPDAPPAYDAGEAAPAAAMEPPPVEDAPAPPPYGEEDVTPPPAETPEEEDAEEEESGRLDTVLAGKIAGHTGKIADHMLRLAPQVGMTETGGKAALTETLSNWLTTALEATPPEEREARLAQLAARLLLMLSYTGAMTQLLGGEPDAPEPAPALPRPAHQPPPRPLRLEDVKPGPITAEELARTIFDDVLAGAAAQVFPYDLAQANPDQLTQMIRKNWDESLEGDALLQQAESQRRNLEQLLKSDRGRAALLGLSKPIGTAEAAAALIGRAREHWGKMVDTARTDFESIRGDTEDYLRSVNPEWSVASLGGSWGQPAAALGLLTGVDAEAGVATLQSATGAARMQAIGAAADLIGQVTARVGGDEMLGLLNIAPFPGRAGLRDRVAHSLGVIGHMLENLRAAEQAQQ